MKTAAFLTGLLATTPALAVTPATYVFRAFVEHGYAAPAAPEGEPLGSVVKITVTVDTSFPGTINGDTATYANSDCPSGQGPIISVYVSGNSFNFAGGCNSIVIVKNTNGPSSITMRGASPQIGTTFNASFTSTQNEVASFNIPREIHTTDFDESRYLTTDPDFSISGHLTHK